MLPVSGQSCRDTEHGPFCTEPCAHKCYSRLYAFHEFTCVRYIAGLLQTKSSSQLTRLLICEAHPHHLTRVGHSSLAVCNTQWESLHLQTLQQVEAAARLLNEGVMRT